MAATHPKVTNEIREVFLKDGVVKFLERFHVASGDRDMVDEELSELGGIDTTRGRREPSLYQYRWKTDPLVNGYVHDSGGSMAAALMNSNTARLYLIIYLYRTPLKPRPRTRYSTSSGKQHVRTVSVGTNRGRKLT